MLMTAADYRESLRALKPRVFVNGRQVASVADEPLLAPGINAIGVTYDFAQRAEYAALMTATQEGNFKGTEGFGEGNFKALFESLELDQMRRGVLTA